MLSDRRMPPNHPFRDPFTRLRHKVALKSVTADNNVVAPPDKCIHPTAPVNCSWYGSCNEMPEDFFPYRMDHNRRSGRVDEGGASALRAIQQSLGFYEGGES